MKKIFMIFFIAHSYLFSQQIIDSFQNNNVISWTSSILSNHPKMTIASSLLGVGAIVFGYRIWMMKMNAYQ